MHPAIWDLIERAKPADRLVLISDALSMSGTGPGRTRISDMDIKIHEVRATLAGSETLAGSVLALDSMVRNVVQNGISLPTASAAASGNPLALLGVTDRGRLETRAAGGPGGPRWHAQCRPGDARRQMARGPRRPLSHQGRTTPQ